MAFQEWYSELLSPFEPQKPPEDSKGLSESQREVTEFPYDRSVIVSAPAGSGKTHTLCHRIGHLVNDIGIEPNQILVLTFTNAAVRAIRERLREIPETSEISTEVRVVTIDSYCHSIITRLSDEQTFYGYDESIQHATLLVATKPDEFFSAFDPIEHILVDEAQDTEAPRSEFISVLLNLSCTHQEQKCGSTIFTDPQQAIFAFTREDRNVEGGRDFMQKLYNRWPEIDPRGPDEPETIRLEPLIFRVRNPAILSLHQEARSIIEGLEGDSRGTMESMVQLIRDWESVPEDSPRTEMRVFRTRVELARHLLLNPELLDKPHRIRLGSRARHVPSWLGEVLLRHHEEGSGIKMMKRVEFERIFSTLPDHLRGMINHEDAWYSLTPTYGEEGRLNTRRLGQSMDSFLSTALKLVSSEDFGYSGPILSTIHASKGLESQRIAVCKYHPRSPYSTNAELMEEARVAYVSITRSSEEFLSFEQGHGSPFIVIPDGSSRPRGGDSNYFPEFGPGYVGVGFSHEQKWDHRDVTLPQKAFTERQEDLRKHPGFPVHCTLSRNNQFRVKHPISGKEVVIGVASNDYKSDSVTRVYNKADKKTDPRESKPLDSLLWYGNETRSFPKGAKGKWTTGPYRKSNVFLGPIILGMGRVSNRQSNNL